MNVVGLTTCTVYSRLSGLVKVVHLIIEVCQVVEDMSRVPQYRVELQETF